MLQFTVFSSITWSTLRHVIQSSCVTVRSSWTRLPADTSTSWTVVASWTDYLVTNGRITVVALGTLVTFNSMSVVNL